MSHTVREKEELLKRLRRIRGQLEGVEKMLGDPSHDAYNVLQTLTAARGALNGLVAGIIEGHIRYHVLNEGKKLSPVQMEALEQTITVIRTYLK